jgi:serine/threonine-protein kinase
VGVESDLAALRDALRSYDFGDVLGRGSWGTVVAAHHRGLNRAVAIKWLRPELVDDAEARARFNAEAQVLASLDHPHIVRVYDYVEVDDVCALVMERLPGGTIADRARVGPIPPQAGCAYALAALHGLEHAHHHGVLHRDVKPENLMLAADGRLRVTDFGIAAIVGDKAERLTQTGITLGTPAYMAPEQLAEPDRIGPYTDVWSTSAVLYELLTRQVPYAARTTLHAALLARATEDPTPILDVTPELPPRLADAVMTGLARDLDERYTTCHEAAEAIDAAATDAWGAEWLSRTGIPLQRTPARSNPSMATGVVPVAKPERDEAPVRPSPRRLRRAVWLPVAGLLAAGGVVAGIALSGGSGHTPEPSHIGGAPPATLPAAPPGWGQQLLAGLATTDSDASAKQIGTGSFAFGVFTGDPATNRDFRSGHGAAPAAAQVRSLLKDGATPYLYTYTLRTTGHFNDDQTGDGLLKIMKSDSLMAAYWQSTIELLKELGSLDRALPLVVDPSVAAIVQPTTTDNDPQKVYTSVAASGVPQLSGIPNTFSGWAQAWVRLRNTLAPKVQLGWAVESYGVGDYLIPNRPSASVLAQYGGALQSFYGGLGTHFDFLDYTVGYGDGAKVAPANVARAEDLTVLRQWVADMVNATGLRVVLSGIPMGNTLMRAVNNKPYHWQDRWAQLMLDQTQFQGLVGLRNAGVIGLVFGYGYGSPDFTCACDAAQDGTTNPAPKGTAQRPSLSADDDGGYLVNRLKAYAAAGRVTV